MKEIKNTIPWLLVVLWMGLIFFFSHQPANQSSELSSGISQIILNIIEKVAPNMAINMGSFHHFIRKNAHLFVYLVLGFLVSNALGSSGAKGRKKIVIGMTICLIYAVSDEVHQLFIPGRAGQVMDVLIDSAGAFIGVISQYMIRRR